MPKQKFYLKPHNEVASKAISSAFKKGQRVVSIVEVTGGGKTYVALDQAMKIYPKKMLFVVPELEITAHIQRTINTYALKDKVNIEFVTYQALTKKSKKELEKMDFEMLVVDEFHHMGAPVWGKRIEQLVESHEDARILGMSAYHIRNRGRKNASDVAPILAEMELDEEDLTDEQKDDLPLFANSTVFNYELAEALVDGVLPLPKYVACNIKLIEYAKRIQEKIEQGTASKEEKIKYQAEIRAILKNLEKAGNFDEVMRQYIQPTDKCIYFAPEGLSDQSAQRKIDEVVKKLKQIFPNAIIYSTTAKDKDGAKNREAFYNDVNLNGEDVSGKLRIMVAIKQYDQGVHAPGVNTVILGTATGSDIVFGQRLGRALAAGASDNVKVVDGCGNIDYIIDLQNACYDIFKEKNSQAQKGLTQTELKLIKSPEFKFILDPQLVDILKKLEEIDNVFDDWNQKCAQYFNFQKANNRWPSKEAKNKQEKSLGSWAINQRSFKKQGILAKRREQILISNGFVFDPREEQFQQNLLADKHFRDTHDGKAPSRTSKDPEENRLAKWEGTCRTSKKNGTLSKEHEEALLAIGWVFDPWEEQFQQNLLADKHFRETHDGKAPSRKSKDPEERQLGVFEVNCRRSKKKGTLSPEHEQALVAIGWVFDPLEEKWQDNLSKAKEAIKQTNNLPKSKQDHGVYLWHKRNVNDLYDGKMTVEHYKQLKRAKVPVDKQEEDEQNIADFFENLDQNINNSNR